MFAQHSQNRGRVLLAAAIGSGLFWSGLGLPNPAQAQGPDPATQLKVSNVIGGWTYGARGKKQGRAVVDIVDGNGNPVNGALVVGNFSGCFTLNGVSDTTETVCWTDANGNTNCVDGKVVILGKYHNCSTRKTNCLFTFTVTDVRKDGMTYVPVEGKTSGGTWCEPLFLRVQRGANATLVSNRQIVPRTQSMPTRRLERWSRR
jgi:hypothetical protein